MTELTGNLQAAMEQYANAFKNLDSLLGVEPIRAQIKLLLAQVDELHEKERTLTQPIQSQLDELEEYIIAQILELGASASHAGVEAKHRAGYDRVTWNNKEMTSLCMKNPALLDLLASARKVTEVDPSVKVSYTWPKSAEEPVEAPF